VESNGKLTSERKSLINNKIEVYIG